MLSLQKSYPCKSSFLGGLTVISLCDYKNMRVLGSTQITTKLLYLLLQFITNAPALAIQNRLISNAHKTKTVRRNSETGRFVTKTYVKNHPRTTETERVKLHKQLTFSRLFRIQNSKPHSCCFCYTKRMMHNSTFTSSERFYPSWWYLPSLKRVEKTE